MALRQATCLNKLLKAKHQQLLKSTKQYYYRAVPWALGQARQGRVLNARQRSHSKPHMFVKQRSTSTAPAHKAACT